MMIALQRIASHVPSRPAKRLPLSLRRTQTKDPLSLREHIKKEGLNQKETLVCPFNSVPATCSTSLCVPLLANLTIDPDTPNKAYNARCNTT